MINEEMKLLTEATVSRRGNNVKVQGTVRVAKERPRRSRKNVGEEVLVVVTSVVTLLLRGTYSIRASSFRAVCEQTVWQLNQSPLNFKLVAIP